MCRIIARFCILTCCCLFATLGAFAEEAPQAKPEPNGNNCYYLNIYITSPTGRAEVPSSGIACEHGDLAKIEPSPTDAKLVILTQSFPHGPDCLITIKSGGSAGVVRVQQNYCKYEAGTVAPPQVISGPIVVTRYETGSYGDSQPGQIWLTVK